MNYLKVVKNLEKENFFTKNDVRKYFSSNCATEKFLQRTVKNKILHRIRKNNYFVKDSPNIDGFLLIQKIFPENIIAYYSAYNLLGHAHFETFGSYVCLTPKQKRPLKNEKIEIIPIKYSPLCGVIEIEYRDKKIKTTDIEMTTIMCIENLTYSLGEENINKIIRNNNDFDINKVYKYLKIINKRNLAIRVLFFLNFIGYVVDKKQINKYKLIKPIRFDTKRENKKLNKEFNIFYPEKLEVEI
jgi:predicted transcriptional regulator of viral defense system